MILLLNPFAAFAKNLPDLYWRACFMDDKSELAVERELFEEYMGNI
jgi:hypothetical protein